MRKAYRTTGVTVGLAMLIGASCLFAEDWPQWRGPNRDDKVKGFVAPQAWPEQFTRKWKVTVGQGDSTPALVGDKLYVFARQGEEEVLLCLDAESGKELWRDQYKAQAVTGPSSRHPGPRSSPALAEGKVVTLGVAGDLSCVDAATGKLVWRKNDFPGAWPQYYTAMSPIIVDGMCIAQLGGPSGGAIIAYDLAKGQEKWRWAGDGPAYASPVLVTVDGAKLIVTLTDKHVVAVSAADGKLAWQIPFVGRRMAYNAATPIVEGQTIIYTGQGRGTAAVKIEKQGDGFAAKEIWSNPELSVQFNTPVLKDGLLYGLSDRGNFFCIDAKTGKTVWTDTASHGNFGAILDVGPVLLALPSDGQLTVLKPDEKACTQVARIKVAEKQTYAHPVVAGKRMYVRDLDSVTLWTVEAPASAPAAEAAMAD